jgi:DNA-binding HxlR family transcriptional regulator
MVSSQEVLNAISDEKSMSLFKTIAVSKSNNSTILNSKMKITRKQYYTRMKALAKVGLIIRKNGIYSLTSFGKVIYNYHLDIETAVNYHWKLKALDSIMTQLSSSSGRIEMPAEEQVKLVDKLIDNDEIKNILLLPTTIATSATTSAADGTKQGKEEEEEEQHAKVSTLVSNRY